MLVKKKISKKKLVVLVVLIGILGSAIAYLLVTNFLLSGDISPNSPFSKSTAELLIVPRVETTFNADFLTKDPFVNLEQHANLPVEVEDVGRTDPFRRILYLPNLSDN